MIKRFLEWIGLKERLDFMTDEPPLVRERDIWWISFGDNVGSEINGKNKLFSRPGIILKKLSRGLFLVLPTTSKSKTGSWYVSLRQERKNMCVCLHQVRVLDYRRFSNRLGIIDEEDFRRIKEGFNRLYK